MLNDQDIAEAKRALKELADEAQGNGNSEGWIAAQERPIRAVIAAHEANAAPAVPQGWKLVPVEPTMEIIQAICDAKNRTRRGCDALMSDAELSSIYRAMLAATPAAPSQPAVLQDSDPTSKEQYRRMFGAACEALGAISDALGCDPEDGGAEPILGAVEELHISLGLSNGILGCLSAAPAVPVAWWIPKAEQFCIAKPSGERPFAKAWEPLYAYQSQPVTLTDGRALKDAFEEGYCSRSTYNDVDISDVETEWAKSSAKASIAALRAKGALR